MQATAVSTAALLSHFPSEETASQPASTTPIHVP